MAKKFSIAQKPTFKTNVNINRVGDTPVEVGFEFKVLTRKELAKYYDSLAVESKEEVDTKDPDFFSKRADISVAEQAKKIMELVVGWDIEEEYNQENLEKLLDTFHRVEDSIFKAFIEEYNKELVKN